MFRWHVKDDAPFQLYLRSLADAYGVPVAMLWPEYSRLAPLLHEHLTAAVVTSTPPENSK